ncbi:MAG: hypothetical protein ACOYB3_02155 [Azonexus sp.]
MPRKSNSDMIAALEAKLAEARAKEAAKSTTRVSYLVEAIKTVDDRIAKATAAYDATVAKAAELRDERVSKLETKRADLDAELADLAVDSAESTQLTFTEAEAEEV